MSDFRSQKCHTVTRREFVKATSAVAAGTVLAGWLPRRTEAIEKYPHWGKVVVVRDDTATDGPDINAEAVQVMIDESIKQLTGLSSVVDAWSSLLPNWKEEHVIAIKVNTLARDIPTHPEVVGAIVAGLSKVGVPENNIIIYDRRSPGAGFPQCGYTHNTGPVGLRCFHSEEGGWDWDHPVEIMGEKRALSRIVTQCDHLINVPVLKVNHHWAGGITLSLKNHYGSVDAPSALHGNEDSLLFARACATLNAQEAIRDKTRLIVTDALFGFWSSGSAMVRDFVRNSLIMSTDPVAADYIGTEMLNEERARHNEPPRDPAALLEKAAEMGLGASEGEIQRMFIEGVQLPAVCTVVPCAVVAGQSILLDVTVVLTGKEPSESPGRMLVDISPLGGASELVVHHTGEGNYTGSTAIAVPKNGHYRLPVLVENAKGEQTRLATAELDVYPDGDLSIYEDGPADGWSVTSRKGEPDVTSSKFSHSGSFSHAISLPATGMVTYTSEDPDGIDLFGYTHLEFYINGGESLEQDPRIIIGCGFAPVKNLSDLGVVLQPDTWALVSIAIPSSATRMKSIYFTGGAKETFYIDDMRLVAGEPPELTAVKEPKGWAVPSDYSLSQNVPNPFNAQTTISYALPKASPMQLAIYSATGQRIRMLVNGYQEARSHSVVWDGKDARGRNVASGVYIYHLKAEGRSVQTRRMTLVR